MTYVCSVRYNGGNPKEGAPVPKMDPVLVRVPEVAAALGIGTTKTKAMIKSGEIESVKVGRARLVPVTAIDAYVQKLRAGAAAPAA